MRRIRRPIANAAIGKFAAGNPMSGIVKAQKRLPARLTKIPQVQRLGAIHVGIKSGAKNHHRPSPFLQLIGQWQISHTIG
jgi:hypothetical protein